MDIFTRTKEDEQQFESFIDKLDSIYEKLKPFESEVDLDDILAIKKSFIRKTDDFFRKDRKLNIGIIGRVKAGKSSFLNTMLFDGKDILPRAVTPKTATLTRIEYDKENRLEIEYYSPGEWKSLEKKANIKSEVKEFVAAKEIIKMVGERQLDPIPFIEMGTQELTYENYDQLMKNLNDYIGENGKYTPLVKSVKIFINKKELEDISIVDTPGLYDPVLSRSDKTKQFIELCDVVFFLSKATGFLDRNDIDLMASQLPQKGVKKMVLICSRFDDGIRDTIWNSSSLEGAIESTKSKLNKYAREVFVDFHAGNVHLDPMVIERCKHPLFVSSMTYNMSKKEVEEFSLQEKKVYEDLNAYEDLTMEQLHQIGNMEEIQNIFRQVIEDKEILLEERASSFVNVATGELADKVIRMKRLAERRINELETKDKEEILQRKRKVSVQVNKVNAGLDKVFEILTEKIEENKQAAIRNMRGFNRDYLEIGEKEGKEKHTEIVNVSASKWFAPWTWGSKKREIYSYEEKYEYIDVLEALEKVRSFVSESVESIEEAFNNSINRSYLKHQLLNTVVGAMEEEALEETPEYYKVLVEKTLKEIKMPAVEISTTQFERRITKEFNGEVTGHANKANMKALYSQTVNDLFLETSRSCEESVARFLFNIDELKINFSKQLLNNLNEELTQILRQFDNKEEEIKRYKELIAQINRFGFEI